MTGSHARVKLQPYFSLKPYGKQYATNKTLKCSPDSVRWKPAHVALGSSGHAYSSPPILTNAGAQDLRQDDRQTNHMSAVKRLDLLQKRKTVRLATLAWSDSWEVVIQSV